MPCSCGSLDCNCQRRCRCRYPYCLCVPCYVIQGNRCHLCGLPSFHRSLSSPEGWCNCFISESHISSEDTDNISADRNFHQDNPFSRSIDTSLPTASLEVGRMFLEQDTYHETQNSKTEECSNKLDLLAIEYHKNENINLEVEYLPIIPMEQTEVITFEPSSDVSQLPTERERHINFESSVSNNHSETSCSSRSYDYPPSSHNQTDSEVTNLINSLNECFQRQNARNENRGRLTENLRKGVKFHKPRPSDHQNIRIFTNSYYKNKNRSSNFRPPVRSDIVNRPLRSNLWTTGSYGAVNYIHPARASYITRPTISSVAVANSHFRPNNLYYLPVSTSNIQSHVFSDLRFRRNIQTIQPTLNPRIIRNSSLRFIHPTSHHNQILAARSNILNWMNSSNINTCTPNTTRQFSNSTFSNGAQALEKPLSNTEVNSFRNEHCGNPASSVVRFRNSRYENAAVVSNSRTLYNLHPEFIGNATSNMLPNLNVSKYSYEHEENSVTTQTSSSDSMTLEFEDTDDSDSIKASSNKSFKLKMGIDIENGSSSKLGPRSSEENKENEKEHIPSERFALASKNAEFESSCSNRIGFSKTFQNMNETSYLNLDIRSQNNKTRTSKNLGNTQASSFYKVGNSFYSSSIKNTVPKSFASTPQDICENSKAQDGVQETGPLNPASYLPDSLEDSILHESVKSANSSTQVSSSLYENESYAIPEDKETNSLNKVSNERDELDEHNLSECLDPIVSTSHAPSLQCEYDSSVASNNIETFSSLNQVLDQTSELDKL